MSDALINNKLYKAPDLTTHFRVSETRLNPFPVAQICKTVENGPEEIIDSLQISRNPGIVEELKKLVTSHGFIPA